jgi:hypothetical protein
MCYVTLDQMTIRQITAIDTVTNLVELVRIDDKTSDNVSREYAQCWLARYPWPQRCIHDPGEELTGIEFQTLLEKCNTKDACTSAKKSAIQCNMRKDALNSWKRSKNILTW